MSQPTTFVRRIDIPALQDNRGVLRVLDEADLPFQCRRIYWLSEVPEGKSRGNHGHRTLEQVFVAVSGSVSIRVWGDGGGEASYSLDQQGPALYVQAGCWRELSDFSSNAVVLVLASHPYDPEDYVFPQVEGAP